MMAPPAENSPEHVEASEEVDPEEFSENPLAGQLAVRITVPDTLDIEVVDHAKFKAYEEWAVFATILLNIFTGTIVALLQTVTASVEPWPKGSTALLVATLITFLLFVGSLYRAAVKRNAMKSRTRGVEYRLAPRQRG